MISFDEINALNGREVIDIEEYFDEMDLPETEKEDRKQFARRLQEDVFWILSLVYIAIRYHSESMIQNAKESLSNAFLEALREFTVPDSFLTRYADVFADEIVDATIRNQGNIFEEDSTKENATGAYFFSDARAMFIAENEANVVFNYEQFRDAKRNGCKYKQWITMRDERVRRTHAEVDGVIVKIDDFFQVGECQMRFPKDVMYCTDPSEIINCRCTVRYLTEEQFKAILRAA